MSRRSPSTRAGVAAVAVVAVVAVPAAPSDAAGTTTYRATTTVGSTELPRPAAVGGWTDSVATATLDVTVLNQSPGTTRVEAGWISPYARTRGACFGQYTFVYRNNSVLLPTPHVVDRVRYREQGGRWSRWITELDEDYLATSPEMMVEGKTTDDCVFLFRKAPVRPIQLEVRHVVEYAGSQRIEETLTVKVP